MKRDDKKSRAADKRHHGKALAAVHETAQGLRDAGVMDKRTMKAFDAMCRTPRRRPRRGQRQSDGNL